ncbi:MAG TPA: family 1 glycosylhydrolase, partial [Acidimicrobiia bacterium]|nr:family 1 glycosylhydrolase [Acidimicrobiia bacterium]
MLRRIAITAVVGLTALTAQLVSGVAPAGATAIPTFGVQFHATWGDYTDAQRIALLDKLAAANIRWVRIDIGWRAWEENGRGVISQWQADMMDRIVAAAEARGIRILGTLWHTPAWANGGKSATTPPDDPNEYARFAQYISARYRGRIAAWEVWNEPNQSGFFTGADPVKYAALVRAAYPAFKAGDPGALVVAG